MWLSGFAQAKQLSGVVLLSSDWKEEAGGYQNEHITKDFVCRAKDRKPRHMKVYWYVKTMSGTDCSVLQDESISEAEYEKLRREHGGVLDTPAYYAAKEKRKELNKQLEALTPTCPKCKESMVSRTGSYGDFWGCANYPQCKATKPRKGSEEAKRKAILDQLTTMHEDSF